MSSAPPCLSRRPRDPAMFALFARRSWPKPPLRVFSFSLPIAACRCRDRPHPGPVSSRLLICLLVRVGAWPLARAHSPAPLDPTLALLQSSAAPKTARLHQPNDAGSERPPLRLTPHKPRPLQLLRQLLRQPLFLQPLQPLQLLHRLPASKRSSAGCVKAAIVAKWLVARVTLI